MISSSEFRQNLQLINHRIHLSAIKSYRKHNEITLVAITKSLPFYMWDLALEHRLTTIGESRIQETNNKNKKFTNKEKIELHLIGHLQKNKAKKAIQLFDVIQTIDSIKLAKRINIIAAEEKKIQKIFLQVNTGNDSQKHGFSKKEIIIAAEEIAGMQNILLIGIMTIPPQDISKNKLQFIYRETRKIRDKIKHTIDNHCKNLSMGMSNDFETAIIEGATHIRIGTALFGER